LSFFPSKNLGGAGDGGMIVCRDPERAEKLRMLRNHGQRTGANTRYRHELLGANFRLDALQAAILNVKLDYLDRFTSERQQNATRYRALLRQSNTLVERAADLERGDQVCLPPAGPDRHVYNQLVVRVQGRDRVRQVLTEREIGTEVYYPVPFHMQPCLQAMQLGAAGSFPHSELACEQALALPIYAELPARDLETVVATLLEALATIS
jgi:dTDP-4-amino-4,6-dideoxygalactose transaminase